MLGWIAFTVVLMAVIAGLTLAWWKIGDQWADAEHKRFAPKQAQGPRPTVIRDGPGGPEPAGPRPAGSDAAGAPGDRRGA